MRQRLNRSTVGMRHHSAYSALVQYVHWPDPSGPDDGVQERTSLHAAGSRKRPRGAALAAALVARELSLACHREHGTQTFGVSSDRSPTHFAVLAGTASCCGVQSRYLPTNSSCFTHCQQFPDTKGVAAAKIRSLLRDEPGMSATSIEPRAAFSPQRYCAIACRAVEVFAWEDKR